MPGKIHLLLQFSDNLPALFQRACPAIVFLKCLPTQALSKEGLRLGCSREGTCKEGWHPCIQPLALRCRRTFLGNCQSTGKLRDEVVIAENLLFHFSMRSHALGHFSTVSHSILLQSVISMLHCRQRRFRGLL